MNKKEGRAGIRQTTCTLRVSVALTLARELFISLSLSLCGVTVMCNVSGRLLYWTLAPTADAEELHTTELCVIYKKVDVNIKLFKQTQLIIIRSFQDDDDLHG